MTKEYVMWNESDQISRFLAANFTIQIMRANVKPELLMAWVGLSGL